MLVCIGTVDNFILMPSPVLDESAQGFHLEQRLQVTLQAAANERQLMIEYRLGEGSDAPSEQLLNAWLESGDLVEALCTGLTARPFIQNKDKTYRRQGKAVQVGDETAHLDTMIVFAGASMSTLADAKPIVEAVKAARASYKRGQREYRAQRNAERVKQMEVQVADRVKQMRERQAAEEATKAAAGGAAEPVGTNGRKR
ncbi:MAG TPA: hypothetical protein VGS80_20995 [Ktedonobacterales bacterium]|nr:hypothetical protein [Ktedonobacterales bacterium]